VFFPNLREGTLRVFASAMFIKTLATAVFVPPARSPEVHVLEARTVEMAEIIQSR
jgi:hypothetical protein